MTRRECLGLAGAALAAAETRRYRVVLIGHTGRGGFGHNWDLGWNRTPRAEVVAVADPDEKGRAAAMARCGAPRGYADYRRMIERERPDIVNIATRFADEHLAMFRAAAEAGAHILIEKPMAQSLPEADEMLRIASRRGIQVQVGHAARTSPTGKRIKTMIETGALGEIVEVRMRGKEDRRAGGEDLIVLGSHELDLARFFFGDPRWVFAHVTGKGREVTTRDGHPGREAVGLFAGDQMAAMFAFDGGLHGYFASYPGAPQPPGDRCGVTVLGTKGALFINMGTSRSAEARLLRSPYWAAVKDARWEPLPCEPEIEPDFDRASNSMALDLMDAIDRDRSPACSARDGGWTLEMMAGIYRSQFSGARVTFPLNDRRDPFQEGI